MGKAALDLPDPLQAPPEGVKTSTDDLLAQLAGDEIDRLLAEADAVQSPVSRAPFHTAPQIAPKPEAEPLPDGAHATPGVPALLSREPTDPSPSAADVSAEMDALFSAAIAKDQPADPATDDGQDETTAAERSGLAAPRGASPAAEALPAGVTPEAQFGDAPLPLYLRPLEWLNAPLTLLPESVRDVVGKVAILTLLNAAAILAYVLVVRRGQ